MENGRDDYYPDFQELEKDYYVLRRYYHHCPKCGKRMSKKFQRFLKCPECGTENEPCCYMLWD